jgi:hypothetical protein
MNRPELMDLLGEHITVTNPHAGTSWTGKLVAIGDEPCVVIDQDHGPRLCLPQSFTVTRVDDPSPAPGSDADAQVEHEDFRLGDVPNDVVIQEALAPFLGGFEEAEGASKAAYEALCITYRRVIVDAEDLGRQYEELERLRLTAKVNYGLYRSAHEEAETAGTALARVRALHPSAEEAHAAQSALCIECCTPAPCPTRLALDGEETDRG